MPRSDVVRPMSHPHEPSSEPEYLQKALEAACDALMTLESERILSGGRREKPTEAQMHVAQAAAALRHAINELRLAHDRNASSVALGFVVPTVSERP